MANTIYIGHASIDENGKVTGGVAGDQTGKEVCKRTWYSKPWDFMAFHPNATVREKHAAAVEDACANAKIGYGQNRRNTLYTQAELHNFDLSAITTACECDCSSLQNVCAIASGAVGVASYGSNGWTTATMKAKLKAAGYVIIDDSTYLKSADYCLRGAIYVKSGSHTVCGLTNGSNYQKTLQKAEVISIGTTSTTNSTSNSYTKTQFIKELQEAIGAKVDGVAGSETLSKTPTLSATTNCKHAAVKPVQRYLYALGYISVGTADGIAGAKFTTAVMSYQNANGCWPDGEITAKNKTWKKLLGLA